MTTIEKEKYRIYAAIRDDVSSGWIWINNKKIQQRSILFIYNPQNKKYLYSEALKIEGNYLRNYNQSNSGRIPLLIGNENEPVIVINEWYRHKLGDIQTQEYCELEITEENNCVGWIMACLHHPQIIVRIATILAIISIFISIISVVIAITS